MDLLNYSRENLTRLLSRRYGKGAYHADALFRHLYRQGTLDLRQDPLFEKNRSLAEALERDYPFTLPSVYRVYREEDTLKFTLDLDPRLHCESVLIRMKEYATLCLSSQLGCRWQCRFCETGRLGLFRSLSSAEILAQVLTARFHFHAEDLRNLVFMGMGEPLENLESLREAIDILTDPQGLHLHAKHISVSTAGYTPGIRELSRLSREHPEKNYHKLHLCLSLHSADRETRDSLMPINRAYPLEDLKKSLLESPFSQRKDGLYIEYIILPGINDSRRQIDKLLWFLDGMAVKINLIPYNPGRDPAFRKPGKEDVDRLWGVLRSQGYSCRTRISRGEAVMAACGQLGNRSRSDE